MQTLGENVGNWKVHETKLWQDKNENYMSTKCKFYLFGWNPNHIILLKWRQNSNVAIEICKLNRDPTKQQ